MTACKQLNDCGVVLFMSFREPSGIMIALWLLLVLSYITVGEPRTWGRAIPMRMVSALSTNRPLPSFDQISSSIFPAHSIDSDSSVDSSLGSSKTAISFVPHAVMDKWKQMMVIDDGQKSETVLFKSGKYMLCGYVAFHAIRKLVHHWQKRLRTSADMQDYAHISPSYLSNSTIFEGDPLTPIHFMSSLSYFIQQMVQESTSSTHELLEELSAITAIMVDNIHSLSKDHTHSYSNQPIHTMIHHQTAVSYQVIQSLVTLFSNDHNATNDSDRNISISSPLFQSWNREMTSALRMSQIHQMERVLQRIRDSLLEVTMISENLVNQQLAENAMEHKEPANIDPTILRDIYKNMEILKSSEIQSNVDSLHSSLSDSNSHIRQCLKVLSKLACSSTDNQQINQQRIVLHSLLPSLYYQIGVVQRHLDNRPGANSYTNETDQFSLVERLDQWLDQSISIWQQSMYSTLNDVIETECESLSTDPIGVNETESSTIDDQLLPPISNEEASSTDVNRCRLTIIAKNNDSGNDKTPTVPEESSGFMSWFRRNSINPFSSNSLTSDTNISEPPEDVVPAISQNDHHVTETIEKHSLFESLSSLLSRQVQMMKLSSYQNLRQTEFVKDCDSQNGVNDDSDVETLRQILVNLQCQCTNCDQHAQNGWKLLDPKKIRPLLSLKRWWYHPVDSDAFTPTQTPLTSRSMQTSLLLLLILRQRYGRAISYQYLLRNMKLRFVRSVLDARNKWQMISSSAEETGNSIRDNLIGFGQRRLLVPLSRIVNDVVFNKHQSLADMKAVQDAKQSLTNMIRDFLKEYHPDIDPTNEKKILDSMDMTPISQEYETELKNPLQNIVSGRIARLLLIQLQFMKKEMLSAMMAIDDLLNANQLHLQVLAITPAIIVFYWLYNFYQTRHNFIRQALQLEIVQKESQSIRSVYHELFIQLKEIDCMLLFSEKNDVGGLTTQAFGKLLTKVYNLLHVITCHETTLSKKHGIDVLKFFKKDLLLLTNSTLSVNQYKDIANGIFRYYDFLRIANQAEVVSNRFPYFAAFHH